MMGILGQIKSSLIPSIPKTATAAKVRLELYLETAIKDLNTTRSMSVPEGYDISK